jgi:hypothetical protein
MKTRSGWFNLRGLFLFVMGFTIGTMLSAAALAGPNTDRAATTARSRVARPHMAQDLPAQKRVVFYVMSSASPIPKPIAYFSAGVPTTTIPMQIIGRGPESGPR